MTVLLGAWDTALGEAAAAKLREENLDVRFLQLDLVRPETIAAAAASIAAQFQHLHILVNNAEVNSVSHGFIATDMNAHRGTQTVEEGAAGPVRLALLPPDGPTGGFFDQHGSHPW